MRPVPEQCIYPSCIFNPVKMQWTRLDSLQKKGLLHNGDFADPFLKHWTLMMAGRDYSFAGFILRSYGRYAAPDGCRDYGGNIKHSKHSGKHGSRGRSRWVGVMGTFNIATGASITINELVREITKIAGEVPIEYEPARPGDVRHSCASIEKAKEALGFCPK